jgi:hypothetical protein
MTQENPDQRPNCKEILETKHTWALKYTEIGLQNHLKFFAMYFTFMEEYFSIHFLMPEIMKKIDEMPLLQLYFIAIIFIIFHGISLLFYSKNPFWLKLFTLTQFMLFALLLVLLIIVRLVLKFLKKTKIFILRVIDLIHKIPFTMLFSFLMVSFLLIERLALVLFKNLLKCLVSISKVIWFALKKIFVCVGFKKIKIF